MKDTPPNSSISIGGGATPLNFDANSAPLETTTLGVNFSKDNDYATPLQIPGGPQIFVRPDQVDTMRTRSDLAARQDLLLHPDNPPKNVHINANGQAFTLSYDQFRTMLQGHGTFGNT